MPTVYCRPCNQNCRKIIAFTDLLHLSVRRKGPGQDDHTVLLGALTFLLELRGISGA